MSEYQIFKDQEDECVIVGDHNKNIAFKVLDISHFDELDMLVLQQAKELCSIVTAAGSRYLVSVHSAEPEYIQQMSYEQFDTTLRQEIQQASRWLHQNVITQCN